MKFKKSLLTIVCAIFAFNSYSQDLEIVEDAIIENQSSLLFKKSPSTGGGTDGTGITRYSGNALKIEYAINSLVIKTLSNKDVLFKDKDENDIVRIGVSPTAHSYFNSTGNFGIGTNSPSEKLEVAGNIKLMGNSDLLFGDDATYIREVNNSLEVISHANLRFYIDANGNNDGDKLQVFGSKVEGSVGDGLFTIKAGGNVGIGTDDPQSLLDVGSGIVGNTNYNDITIGNASTNTGLQIFSGSSSHGGISFHDTSITSNARTSYDGGIYYDHGNNEFQIWSNKEKRVMIDLNGNVGIGTNSASEKLEVNGNLKLGENKDLIFGSDATHIREVGNTLEVISHASLRFYIDEHKNSTGDKFQVFGNISENWNGVDDPTTPYSKALFTIEEDGNVGIGTDDPLSALHVSSPSINFNSNFQNDANLIIYGSGNRDMNKGVALGFSLSSKTDSENTWQHGRIMVMPDDENSGRADGKMFLQTRYYGEGTWRWRDGIVIDKSGNVGIGIDDPNEKLEVDGSIAFKRNSAIKLIPFVGGGNPSQTHSIIKNGWRHNQDYTSIHAAGMTPNLESSIVIKADGNVGIGTTDPQNKLSVQGTIWATKMKVSMTDAADWVFEDDYELKSLEEVESFVKTNKHLPDVPSADEFRENDLNVAEMDNLLLQKVEELTLYMIEMNKQMKVQSEEIQFLKAKNTELENRIK